MSFARATTAAAATSIVVVATRRRDDDGDYRNRRRPRSSVPVAGRRRGRREDGRGRGAPVRARANASRGEAAASAKAVADRDVERGAGASTAEGAPARRAAAKSRGCVDVVVATEDAQFEIAARLRATAFYDDLLERGEMPFPPRFTATFHREFAQRERRALRERTTRKVGPALESTCYMAECEGMGLVGCLDASVREGPCASQINGVCVREGTSYAYVDNVAVDAGARRRGSARLMMECASDFAEERGLKEIWTHVHCDNLGARALYHAFGFRAPSGAFPENGLPNYFNGERLKGLILLRAPIPLVYMDRVEETCGCGACFDGVSECICSKPHAR